MPDRTTLHAQSRELTGKKVGRLRREGILPATIYGHNVRPQNIQVNARDFRDAFRRAGSTQLLDLVIDENPPRPVLIRQMGFDAKKHAVMHVEFFQANLRETITTHVPIHTVGESAAVREGGILLQVLDHVDIESLPQNVPAGGIEVDISRLEAINDSLTVGDLTLPGTVSVVTPGDEIVVKVNPPTREEVVEENIAVTEPLPTELGGEEAEPKAVPES